MKQTAGGIRIRVQGAVDLVISMGGNIGISLVKINDKYRVSKCVAFKAQLDYIPNLCLFQGQLP